MSNIVKLQLLYLRGSFLTEKELIKEIKNGNINRFEEIVNQNKANIEKIIIGILGNCNEAEDIGQETFIKFYKSINNFQCKSSIKTYLTRIAINLSLNEIKKRKKRKLLVNIESLENIEDQKSANKNVLDKNIIRNAMEKLDGKYSEVIVLRLINNYSTEEVAEILKLPVGTVLSRLFRAQKQLKLLLKPVFGDEYE